MPTAARTARDLRLDFFRGIALWLIFVNHIPFNVVSWVSTRNYGFSDATEIFVFISGFTAALVYGRVLDERGPIVATARVLRRAWQLYVAFVFLFVMYMALIAYVTATFENPLYAEEINVLGFFDRPDVTLLQAILLKFRPANTDVLPLYIVLMLSFPLFLILLKRWPDIALALSAAFYALVIRTGLNLPAYPSGNWVFNPFAWQFLFVLGAWCACGGVERLKPVLQSSVVLVLAIAYLVFACVIALSWVFPALGEHVPNWLGNILYPIDKTNLDILRVLHFLALALVVARLLPAGAAFLSSPLARPAIVCGQHSLEIFCFGVFLSFGGHFVLTEFSRSLAMQVLVSVTGIAAMVFLASLMAWYKGLDRQKSAAEPNGERVRLEGAE